LANFIKLVIISNDLLDGDYVELYAGGASIALSLLFEEYVRRVHINDLDRAVFAFWKSVVETPDELCALIQDTPVKIEEWYRQRAVQTDIAGQSTLELAFSTFFLNRTNRSGILRGGVIGGKAQNGSWKLDARFNKKDLISRIQRIARYSDRISVYNLDASEFISAKLCHIRQRSLVFLDPPYYNKGQDLYQNHYAPSDHAHLAATIERSIRQPWVISYDAAPRIMELYKGRMHSSYNIHYSAQTRYAGREVIFWSDCLRVATHTDPPLIKPTDLIHQK
jgi:DNA adenine methylase